MSLNDLNANPHTWKTKFGLEFPIGMDTSNYGNTFLKYSYLYAYPLESIDVARVLNESVRVAALVAIIYVTPEDQEAIFSQKQHFFHALTIQCNPNCSKEKIWDSWSQFISNHPPDPTYTTMIAFSIELQNQKVAEDYIVPTELWEWEKGIDTKKQITQIPGPLDQKPSVYHIRCTCYDRNILFDTNIGNVDAIGNTEAVAFENAEIECRNRPRGNFIGGLEGYYIRCGKAVQVQ